jgi:tRNA pseudouridine55 synthase
VSGDTDSGSENGDENRSGGENGAAFGRGPPADRTPQELLEFGVVNLDKPPGPSAHQVSGWVRDMLADSYDRLATPTAGNGENSTDRSQASDSAGDREGIGAGIDRAAHTGTLDPTVTGCLPVLTGRATRLSGALLTPKEYVAVLEVHSRLPEGFESIVGGFVGPIYQKPPRKSAVSRRLRVREVYGADVLDAEERRALLRIECESGTYVRKLCHDLGLALGTGAHMGDLRRTRAEPFGDGALVTLHDLADALAAVEGAGGEIGGVERENAVALSAVVQPAERALVHLPRLTIAHSAAREVANGAPVYAPGVLGYDSPLRPLADRTAHEGANREGGEEGPAEDSGKGSGDEEPLVACYTPDGAVVCLGELVGDPEAQRETVLDTERVLV